MKEPKYVKYEEDSKDNQGKRYNFFEEGLFPEKEDEKKLKNKSSQKKQQKYPFSLPEQEKKRISNTQKEDLLPFFAKNYPSSSESKEDICFINTPAPSNSNTYSGGEAEEVEGIEEEDEKNEKSEEKKINNEDYELSVDFNSEIEAEQERPSKTMTREEILSRIKEKKKKDEEEKKKKEEERKKKEEEEKKRKELEEKKKKEREEKLLREQEIKRQKMIEEEKRRQKEEEEKRIKEIEEKRKRELSKKKREERKREEQRKKLEEEKKKNNASGSGNKDDKFNLLSSIKKNNNDNSYMASNSIINEVKQIFPETIPEENDGEDDDFSKKNFRGSSKKKTSNKNSIKENKINDSQKSKKVSNFNDNLNKYKNNKRSQDIKNEDIEEEENENEDEDENTEKKNVSKKRKTKSKKSIGSKVSQKSNGLDVQYVGREIIKKISEEDNVSELSNYGDELIDAEDKNDIKEEKEEKEEYDSDIEPKKKKVRKNDKKKSKPKKRKNSKQKHSSKMKSEYTNRELEIGRYNALDKIKTVAFIPQEPEEKTFGNGRYSLRNRFRALNHTAGEKLEYTYIDGLPTLTGAHLINRHAYSDDAFLREKTKKKKKRLVKSSNLDDKLDDISEENEYNSKLLESQDISEYGEDDSRFLKIPKGGKKSKAKNYDTLMIIRVHDAEGRNMIRVDNKEYKDLKTGDKIRVYQNQVFEILNFSDNHLIVQLLFDDEE